MNENIKTLIILMGFMIVGGICGYCINEVMAMNDYSATCNSQCKEYMDKYCVCINSNPDPMPVFNFNLTEGEK